MKKTLLSTLVLFTLLLCGCSYEEPPLLNATFQVDRDFLYIENKEAFDLTEVDVKINDEYTFTIPELKAGKTHARAWVNITKEDGTRFNNATTRVQSVFIYGYTPERQLRNISYSR